jgi:hypothetical protein
MKYSTTSTIIIDIDGGTAQRRNVGTAAYSCFALSCKLLDDDAICRSDWTAIYLVCFDGLFRVLAKGQGWLGQSIALNYCNANECCLSVECIYCRAVPTFECLPSTSAAAAAEKMSRGYFLGDIYAIGPYIVRVTVMDRESLITATER